MLCFVAKADTVDIRFLHRQLSTKSAKFSPRKFRCLPVLHQSIIGDLPLTPHIGVSVITVEGTKMTIEIILILKESITKSIEGAFRSSSSSAMSKENFSESSPSILPLLCQCPHSPHGILQKACIGTLKLLHATEKSTEVIKHLRGLVLPLVKT